jgi:predicted transcriptional regulator
MTPEAKLGDVMSRPVQVAREEQTLAEIEHHFEVISGLPVVDADGKCIGVISRKDKAKASNGVGFSFHRAHLVLRNCLFVFNKKQQKYSIRLGKNNNLFFINKRCCKTGIANDCISSFTRTKVSCIIQICCKLRSKKY